VARAAPSVSEHDELPALLDAMARNGIDAAVVLGVDQQPLGVVTKSALVSVILDWYVTAPRRQRLEATPR
jgi:hypothetical protein